MNDAVHNGYQHTLFVTIEKAFLLCRCFPEMFRQTVTDHKDENGNPLPSQLSARNYNLS
jgi:hypothetical protein